MKSALSLMLWLMFGVSSAVADPPDNFSLRLAKSADNTDASKPATLGYQRNDGGEANYVTEGALKADIDFLRDNEATFSPAVSWNHNTLATSPTNTWSYGFGAVYRWLLDPALDTLYFSGNLSQQRDIVKSSNATVVKASTTWYGWPEWKKPGVLDFASIRPTVTVFSKHVYDAPADKITGTVPTGTLAGGLIALNGKAILGRWSLGGTAQLLRPTHVVTGDTKVTHRLYTTSVTYQFVDSPPTDHGTSPGWIPSISLIRQVGDDPLNAVAKSGFTQLALTVQY